MSPCDTVMLCDFWAQSGKGRRTPITLVVPGNIPYIFREMLLESQKNLQTWPQPMEFRLHTPQLPASISVCPGARGQKGKNEETSGMLQRQIQDDSGRYVQITDSIRYSRVRTPYSAFLSKEPRLWLARAIWGTRKNPGHAPCGENILAACWMICFTVQQQSSRAPKTSKLEAKNLHKGTWSSRHIFFGFHHVPSLYCLQAALKSSGSGFSIRSSQCGIYKGDVSISPEL